MQREAEDVENYGDKFYDLVDIKISEEPSTEIYGASTPEAVPYEEASAKAQNFKTKIVDSPSDQLNLAQKARTVNAKNHAYVSGGIVEALP